MRDTTSDTTEAPTRRDTLKYGSTLVTGSVLAGCSELVGRDNGAEGTNTQGSYEACIEPVGCLSLEEVPETWMAILGSWADMAFALGQRDGFRPSGFYCPAYFYERVGLSMPTDFPALTTEDGYDKEVFYELDPDVILSDPNYLTGWGSWSESDVQELTETVGPFFGNSILRRMDYNDYTLYSLYEAFERLADLFQERERYEAFAAVHDEMQAEIQSRLPPETERPEIGLVNFGSAPSEGQFSAMTTESEGVEMKQYRDFAVQSAFSEAQVGTEIDYETMLDIDPEIIILHSGVQLTGEDGEFSASKFHEEFVAPMEDHVIGRQLTAVAEGNVYPGAYYMQGPIVNLFQTELTAQLLFPDEFGEFDPESYPDLPAAEQLFDRQRVADIIGGES
ncbi:ferrichrome-binding protein (plasmid) [Halostagnicola larsenii XH-48]|uniref:Ferrichrome-binding protein n=1 Tax=Halostagnicola larsenii XH-48 TaxID=797299 RepID=W0JW66_9EURY|nr:ABC transporter substrate-binding protein [Halostagnicola larsenii]AHG01572.1 ferrichrome-binding protein [Halostagnicola larsenii XH-48]